ncbi:thiol-activated cytolysin C-terminal domain-containing protein [Streptococcus pseudopneumoniae]|nr:thiol-activated cytolysin C-terminal domain-containing protein [Streptococcus pseudopneumoniae]
MENIALGKQVTQSSTAFGGDARRAVDGKVDGNYGHNSVTHTNFQSKPWWQVDLAKEETIRQINIYNRTDTAQDRLANFDVILLDSSGKEIERKRITSLKDVSAQIAINHKKARYVRIELEGYNALSLAEVEVFRFIATNGETATQVSKPVQPISQTPAKDKTLTIQHSGAYIARYSITWEEVTVDKDGNQVVRSRSWEGNGRNQTAGFVLNLPIKENMRNLRIKIEKKTGLLWNRWQTIYENRPILTQPHRKITHWGTTLNSKISDDDVL